MLAEHYECVTVFSGEVLGLTELITDLSASEVSDSIPLSDPSGLYLKFRIKLRSCSIFTKCFDTILCLY